MRDTLRALVRLSGRLLLALAIGLGWVAFALVACAWLAEQTGLLRTLVRDALRSQAGALADDLDCSNVSLAWFDPALEIGELTIGPQGEALRLRDVRTRFSFTREHGIEIASIETRSGHVRISPALVNGLKGFSRALGPAPEPASGAGARVQRGPHLTVRDLAIDWDTRQWGRLPIGRADITLDVDPVRGAELNGRLVPYLAPLDGSMPPGETGEITLRGRPSGAETFEVDAWAVDVPLSTASIPKGTALDGLAAFAPRGKLGLMLSARFSLDGSELTRANLRVRMRDVRSQLPSEQHLDAGVLAIDAEYAPRSAVESWMPQAWHGTASFDVLWNDVPLRARSVFGERAGAGRLAKVWFVADALPLQGALPALIAPSGAARERWNAFEPRGSARVTGALEIPSTWHTGTPLDEHARCALRAEFDGHGGMTYHGWPNLPEGRSNQGFPLPIDGVRGDVAVAVDPAARQRARVALFELGGRHPSGPIVCSGHVQAPPRDAAPDAPGHGYAELDLQLSTPALEVDETLEHALEGLSGALPPDSSWRPFEPRGGRVSIDLRLQRTVQMHWLSTDLELGLNGVGLRWKELKLPVREAQGRLRFRSDGVLGRGIAVSAQGRLETARTLAFGLRMEIDARVPDSHHARALDEIVTIRADVEHASLIGEDQKRLSTRFPEIGQALALAAARGFVDGHYERTRPSAGAATTTCVEVAPAPDAPVELQLADFPIPTRDVRGRVLTGIVEQADSTETRARTSIAPLVGRWGTDVEVAFEAEFPARSVRVLGAGVDPAAPTLRGSLAQVLGGGASGAETDISGIGLAGRVDFQGDIRLAAGPDKPAESRFRIHLRDDTFTSGQNFKLRSLRGVLTLADGVMRGETLSAKLASTPVALTNAEFRTTNEGFRFDTDLSAENVPLDREHLSAFVDPVTLRALLEDLKWSGELDVHAGHVTLSGPRQGDSTLVFRGQVSANEMSIVLGLPLVFHSAEASIEELVLEGGKMRAFARVTQLFGRIAGRALGPAEMLVTYVDPRLSIEELSGKFAGGELQPLGEGSDRGGTLFSIDLEEPYPFQLALDLRDVRLEELLQGLFASNIANKGRLNAQLRLTGDTENLLAVEGSGSIFVRDSYLWSVPVIRSLLSILRLGSTVTFDSMATNIVVRDGSIVMRDIRVASSALQLAGKGKLGFDGALDYELEGQLNEIKNLEWFSKLISFVTDNLVSVTITGDLDRPSVERHILPFLFRGKDSFRALPLPGYAPLPPRF